MINCNLTVEGSVRIKHGESDSRHEDKGQRHGKDKWPCSSSSSSPSQHLSTTNTGKCVTPTDTVVNGTARHFFFNRKLVKMQHTPHLLLLR